VFLIRDLVSARTWLATASVLAGFVTGLVSFCVVVAALSFGVGGLAFALAGLPLLGCLLYFNQGFAAAERRRLGFLLDARLAGWPAAARGGYVWKIVPRWRTLRNRAAWSELGYALLRGPLSLAGFVVVFGAWSFGLAMLTLPFYLRSLPRGGVVIGSHVLSGTPITAASVAGGLILLLAAPQITRGLAAADVAIASRLLGPRGDLAARVQELETSRERVVDAAEAERRRIERDLHDGAQQRLVALAMELGRARVKFADDIDAARLIVDQAHAEAKEALTELRNLVRGVHPPVLTERGLDAALSGLAALCPVPVAVHVDVPVRPKPAVEAIAYFVVAEALTNVAKHSRASAAKVWVEGHGYPGTITVMVSDDGIGGATTAGSGLSGLADRVAGVDGKFSVESPSGGPTIIAVELPCG
jgi:signal transduction histidine kinase